jgi:hypothetical protein
MNTRIRVYHVTIWDVHDFNEVEKMYLDDSEEYDISHPNQDKARTLLVTTHNLFEKQNEIIETSRNAVGLSVLRSAKSGVAAGVG